MNGDTYSELMRPRSARAAFPLTPTLSLGKRENRFPIYGIPLRAGSFTKPTNGLSLPKGEGWGEGERTDRLASMGVLLELSQKL